MGRYFGISTRKNVFKTGLGNRYRKVWDLMLYVYSLVTIYCFIASNKDKRTLVT